MMRENWDHGYLRISTDYTPPQPEKLDKPKLYLCSSNSAMTIGTNQWMTTNLRNHKLAKVRAQNFYARTYIPLQLTKVHFAARNRGVTQALLLCRKTSASGNDRDLGCYQKWLKNRRRRCRV